MMHIVLFYVYRIDYVLGLIWASLGAKTIELVHQNINVGEADEDMDILAMDADLIDEFLDGILIV